ncbi:MAG: bacillithiol biosynthesis cysteine-adding enzyme BshC [Chitinophagaceae bacterium]
MNFISIRLPYRQTGYFSKTVIDYLDQLSSLKPFFSLPPSAQGIQQAIENRKKTNTNRQLLVEQLRKQYAGITSYPAVQKNIEALLSSNCFTITTAHQPNLFTGPLYFIYKIVHAIKLAEHCRHLFPEYNFLPVFFMGSEDADFDELGHFYLNKEKHEWATNQTGAFGRMKVDKQLMKLIDGISGQLTVLPYGNEILQLIRDCYVEGETIQQATFRLINALFGDYGLLVLISDNAELKKQMAKIFEDELLNERAAGIVEETVRKLSDAGYKTQVNPREINLFYLKDNIRERIIRTKTGFATHDLLFTFNDSELLKDLQDHPEYFSPNVILRGLYQETILPNLVFIGGGGELAYWIQLKELFQRYQTPFPVLVLRNSFLIIESKWQEKITRLGFTAEDFFQTEEQLMNWLVARESKNQIQLNGFFSEAIQFYEQLKKQAAAVDVTLAKHVEALKTQSLARLQQLEKKMLRAEKRKFTDQQRQIHTIKENLFPKNGLQERIENFMYYYAKWGREFFKKLYDHSPALEQEFVVVAEF